MKSRLVALAPSVVTATALASGWVAIATTAKGDAPSNLRWAAGLILAAFVFDALDGRLARLLGVSSEFGAELDSLSDLVAFGVAPAFVAYRVALEPLGAFGVIVALTYVLMAALRLARFNVAARTPAGAGGSGAWFEGLATPFAAGVIASAVLARPASHRGVVEGEALGVPLQIWIALGVLILAGLMVSKVPYTSFKRARLKGPTLVVVLCVSATAIGVSVAYSPAYVPGLFFGGYLFSGIAGIVIAKR